MKRTFLYCAVLIAVAACGGDASLTAEELEWCLDNTDIVDSKSEELGLLDFVQAYYDTEGDGIESDGEPRFTDRNVELSENLRARNAEDPDQLFDDLFANYFEHPDGREACSTAFAEST